MPEPIKTNKTPDLNGQTIIKPSTDDGVKLDGENFIISVNGFVTILDKEQAIQLYSALGQTLAELAQKLGPPHDDFMMGK